MTVELGNARPQLLSAPPGPRARAWVERLAAAESPAFTARRARRAEASGATQDPIVWERAAGCNVEDVDGSVYVDLTSGFGVAAVGHRHPRVLEALRRQSDELLHALGDVHPSRPKIMLQERLGALTSFEEPRTVLGLSGADALEVAIKSAVLSTGRSGVVAFHGSYHGLSAGPLALTGYKESFRRPFAAQLNPHVHFLPFPRFDFSQVVGASEDDERHSAAAHTWELASDQQAMASLRALDEALRTGDIGAVVVEPIQGRGGIHVPPRGFLAELARRAHAADALVIADEIFVGLGRTGSLLRGEHEGLDADLVCVGKALGGGLPVSACVGRAEVMRAWGDPGAEAIHTGTFFGYPLGCATALATLDIIESERLAARARAMGSTLRAALRSLPGVREVSGAGLLAGVRFTDHPSALPVVSALLARGYLTLPAGTNAEVLEIIPALTIDPVRLDEFVTTLRDVLVTACANG